MKAVLKGSFVAIMALGIACVVLSCTGTVEERAKVGSENIDTAMAFPIGDEIVSENFIGSAWLNYLVPPDSVHNVNIGQVTFEPGSRTNWHYHAGGQILLVTEGMGLYQERGNPVRRITEGDVVKCPPKTDHWHGASPTDKMTHIAIGTNLGVGGAVWKEPVSDEEYLKSPQN